MWWYLLFILGVGRLFMKTRDLFLFIEGFLFSRDMVKRLIHDKNIPYLPVYNAHFFYCALYTEPFVS